MRAFKRAGPTARGRHRALSFPEVGVGVRRLGSRWANFYLVTDGDDALVIDAGYPGYASQIDAALAQRMRVAGVIVTHHHVDHAGTAEHTRARLGARVFVHPDDAPVVCGERRSHVPPGFYRQAWRPSMVRYLAHTVRVGGARYRPVAAAETIHDGEVLDLPGRPRIIYTPGHTAGHCSVVLDDRGVLFAGDALTNFDYASGTAGLALHRFNEDRPTALRSLDRLDALDADTVLFGHGDPWTQGVRRAVEIVRTRA